MFRLHRALSLVLLLAFAGCGTFGQRDLDAAKGAVYGAACGVPIAVGAATGNLVLIIAGSFACVGAAIGASQPEPPTHIVRAYVVEPPPERFELIAFVYAADPVLLGALQQGLEERGWRIYPYRPRPREVSLVSASVRAPGEVIVKIILPGGTWLTATASTVEKALSLLMRRVA
ncbi:MAG: hypothetical protein HY471_00680 [Candidatus Sungbacteria bacterium]|nr:hypothetical protein [Candidatus Sungbacteria bacterium]